MSIVISQLITFVDIWNQNNNELIILRPIFQSQPTEKNKRLVYFFEVE